MNKFTFFQYKNFLIFCRDIIFKILVVHALIFKFMHKTWISKTIIVLFHIFFIQILQMLIKLSAFFYKSIRRKQPFIYWNSWHWVQEAFMETISL